MIRGVMEGRFFFMAAGGDGVRSLVKWAASLVIFARTKPVGATGGIVLVALILTALLANHIAPYDPLEMRFEERLMGPSRPHLLGTDNFGRDVLSNVIHGARLSLYVGFVSVVVGTGIGLILGLVSGYTGGTLDLLTQRLIDILLAMPALLLAMALIAALGTSVANTIVAVSLVFVPTATRVVRASAITAKEMTYVEAARALGASPSRILFRHILPQCLAPYLIVATTSLGQAILLEASLSFLGVGVPPPAPSWGRMLSGIGRLYLTAAPWLSVFPGLAITISVLAFNMLGDALRDVWDPRLRGGGMRAQRGRRA